jgi:hypothetical protein
MSNLSSGPKSAKLPAVSGVAQPVPYSTSTGLALLLSNLAISGSNVARYTRQIPTADFISGNYQFPVPDGYAAAAYRLPMLEPTRWNVSADVIDAYQPVEVYQIGNKSYTNDQGVVVPADMMAATFPVNIYPNKYTGDDQSIIDPFAPNQSVLIHIYKNTGVNINWEGGNIVNSGAADDVIAAATELAFVITNVNGTYRVTEWLMPHTEVFRSTTENIVYANNGSGAPSLMPYGVTPEASTLVQRDAAGFPVAPTTGATGGQTPSSDEVNARITSATGTGVRAYNFAPVGSFTVYEDPYITVASRRRWASSSYTWGYEITNKSQEAVVLLLLGQYGVIRVQMASGDSYDLAPKSLDGAISQMIAICSSDASVSYGIVRLHGMTDGSSSSMGTIRAEMVIPAK